MTLRLSKIKQNQQSGQILILALVFLGVLLSMSAALVGYSTIQIRAGRTDYAQEQALELAEAGLDNAIGKLNLGSYSGETDTALGPGTYTVVLNVIDTNDKTVVSTGYIPNSTNPIATRTVQAQINFNSTAVGFGYGMQIGLGGLNMSGKAAVNGNVYSDGSIVAGAPKDNPLNGTVVVASGVANSPDQSLTLQNTDGAVGDTLAHTDAAQSFVTTSATNNLARVSLYLKLVGSPGDLNIQIMTDNAGKPSTTPIASGTIKAASAGSGYAWLDVGLSGIPTITVNQKYWIMLIAPAVSNSSYWVWGTDNTNTYTSGDGYYSPQWNATTPVWTASGTDFNFRVYLGGTATSITGGAISGDAKAHSMSGCTISGNAFYGSSNTCTTGGTSTGSQTDQPYQPLPITDAEIANWEAVASTGPTYSGNPYSISTNMPIGPAVINSDLDVTGTMDLTGPVWVKGNANFHSASVLTVDAALGDAGAVMVLDKPGNSASGLASLVSGTIIHGNGNPHSFPMVLSNSTSTTAISLAGNGSGVILYAPKGTVNVSGNGSANQVSGNAIVLSSGAVITYNTGLANANFLNGPGGSWVYTPATFVITK